MKKTKHLMITVQAGLFNWQQTIKFANAIKIYLKRLAEEKGYFIDAVIGVSENDCHTGKVTNKKTGKRGRPKKVFVYNSDCDFEKKVDPHIHIVLHANPADHVANRLMAYINKSQKEHLSSEKRTVCRKSNCDDYYEYEYEYVRNQSKAIRTVCVGKEPINETVSQRKKRIRIIFTKYQMNKKQGSIDKLRDFKKKQKKRKVECNKTRSVYIGKIVSNKESYRYLVIYIVPP